MTNDDFDAYLQSLGFTIAVLRVGDDQYTVIQSVTITKGTLTGKVCTVALQRPTTTPYAVAPAIHTTPALIPMGTLSTQASPLGSEWQYWSRRFDRPPTPQLLWAHVLTVLGEA